MENGLYLLGDSEAPVQLDEWKLIREWFEINRLYLPVDDPEQCLFIHPCRDYLRRETFHKLSVSSLI